MLLTRRWGHRKNRIVKRFVASYLVLLIVPLALGISIYLSLLPRLETQANDSVRMVLQNERDVIDKSLHEVNTLIHQLLNDPKLGKFLISAQQRSASFFIEAIDMMKTIPRIVENNRLIKTYYIHCGNSDLILAPEQAFLRPERYYDTHFKWKNLSYDAWRDTLLYTEHNLQLLPAQDIMLNGQSARIVLLAQSFPEYRGGVPIGQILIYLDEEEFLRMMRTARDVGASFSYIINTQGQILASERWEHNEDPLPEIEFTGESGTVELSIGGTPTMVNYMMSNTAKFYYVLGVSKSVIDGRAAQVLRITLYFTIVIVAVGIVIALFMARLNGGPLWRIAQKLFDDGRTLSAIDNYRQIDDAVNHLLLVKDDLAREIEGQQMVLRQTLFAQIINGGLTEEREARALLEQLGLRFTGPVLRGILLRIGTKAESHALDDATGDRAVAGLYQSIVQCPALHLLSHEMGTDLLYLLFVGEAGDAYRASLTQLYRDAYNALSESMTFYVGNVCTALTQAHRSFATARQLFHFSGMDGTHFLITEDDAQTSPRREDAQENMEKKIRNLLTIGDYTSIEAMLDEYYRVHFLEGELSIASKQRILCRFIVLLADLGEKEQLDILMKQGWRYSPDATFEAIKAQCEKLCLRVNQQSADRSVELAASVRAYIDEQYSDANLSLNELSMHFGMNESHLSAVIKRVLGETFSTLLEEARMRKANELLAAGEMTINEIAEQTGYLSPHSFRRAYKRVMGYPPSAAKKGDQ